MGPPRRPDRIVRPYPADRVSAYEDGGWKKTTYGTGTYETTYVHILLILVCACATCPRFRAPEIEELQWQKAVEI